MTMIELNGNFAEGGGALLRVALAASTLSGKPFKVEKIRAGRDVPGLKAQHLAAIKALQEMSGAKVSEVDIGSTEIWFHPGDMKGGKYEFDIGTAGSITLFLQAILLPAMFASSKVTITVRGGTCGKWQASVDYLQEVLLPFIKRFVKKLEVKIVQRGYYPKGQGEVLLEISPKLKRKNFKTFEDFLETVEKEFKPIIATEQGNVEQVKGILNLSAELEDGHVSERIVSAAKNYLREKLGEELPIQIRIEARNTASLGGELLLWTIHSIGGQVDLENPLRLSGDALLEKGKESSKVAREAVDELLWEEKKEAAVDKFLADQLLQFMILVPDSEIKTSKITPHCETNWYVLEEFFQNTFSADTEKNIIKVEKA